MSYALVAYGIVILGVVTYAGYLLRERRGLRKGLADASEPDRG